MRSRALLVVLLCVLLFVPAAGAWADVTAEQREALSNDMLAEIVKVNGPVQDVNAEDQVHQIFYSLVQHTKRSEIRYRVAVIQNDSVNAYALPDGRVTIFSGLLNRLPRNDTAPLAFICAHEISHIEKKHAEKRLQGQLVTGGILAILARAARVRGNVASIVGGLAFQLITSGNSRSAETEADREGLALVRTAGFDPNGALYTLKLLGQLETSHKSIRVFPTHPRSADRYRNVVAWLTTQGIAVREPDSVAVPDSSTPAIASKSRGGSENLTATTSTHTDNVGPRITDAAMCRSLDDQGRPAERCTVFSSRDRFYISLLVADAVGKTVEVRWHHQGQQFKAQSHSATCSPEIVQGWMQLKNGWPAGRYSVQIFIDGQHQRTLNFSVE